MGLLDDVKAAINPVTIDQFKSTIGKRGGVAKGNRYSVTITPPTQSLINTSVDGAIASALSGNLSLGGFVNDPRDINILCSACSLPGHGIQTTDYSAFNQFATKHATNQIFEDAEFTFHLTNDYYVKKMFDKWQSIILSGQANAARVAYKQSYVSDVIIQQLDEKNTPIYGVKLINAFPTTVSAVQLGNGQAEPATINVNMAYDRFVVEGSVQSTVNSVRQNLNLFQKLI